MDNPRKLAFASLVRADALASYSNIEINTVISRSELTKKNAALYTALYMGVTEKLITLDYAIAQYSSVSVDKLDIETKNALRLGFYQLMFMDRIPDYSAVSETVSICPKKSKGFVNAVLRSFLRSDKKVEYPNDEWERFSVISSTPPYIIDIFRRSYGDEAAKAILSDTEDKGGVSLRINTLKVKTEDILSALDKKGVEYKIEALCGDVIVAYAPISELDGIIGSGDVFVQDIASRTAVRIFEPKAGMRILDACACPGGKSFSSAIDMENKGEIISCDLHRSKLSLIERGAKNLCIDIIKTREQNGKEYVPELDSSFDKVLCDVPCSGLGVIRKKPDIKYKKADSVDNLPSIQLDILKNCSKYVKIGGELMYSTCTLNRKENEDIVEEFLKDNGSFEYVDFSVGSIESVGGMYTFLPHITGSDGFFVANMRRVK